jgi:hypothetical protein
MSLDVTLKEEPCKCCGRGDEVYSANITHNLTDMALEAGLYEACWHPEDIDAKRAGDIIPILREGIDVMRADPDRFRAFDAKNRWGIYDDFLPWLERYLKACEENPDALINTSV